MFKATPLNRLAFAIRFIPTFFIIIILFVLLHFDIGEIKFRVNSKVVLGIILLVVYYFNFIYRRLEDIFVNSPVTNIVFIVFFLLPDLSEFSEFFFYFDPNEEDPETPITDIIDYLCLIAWGIFLFFTPSGYISNQYLNNSNTNNHAETTQSSDKATQSSDKLSDTYYWGSITVKFVNFNLKEYAYITKALSTQLPKRNELRTIHLEKSPSDLYINGVLSKSSYVNDEFVNEIIQSTYQ